MRINRESILVALEAVRPGLSKREVIEQSDCVVFDSGTLYTYNDEVCCRVPSGLTEEFQGAFPAEKILAQLSGMPDENVDLEMTETGLLISGKRRRAEVFRKAEVVLPFRAVTVPDEWTPLPGAFAEAVDVVRRGASRDEGKFLLSCIHVTPEWLEACDNYQAIRWPLETGFSKPTLFRAPALASVVERGPSEFAEAELWTHFQDMLGRQYSVRCYADAFPDLGPVLAPREGEPAHLPRELADLVPVAQSFADGDQGKLVRVTVTSGRVVIRGEGPAGWVEGRRKVSYAGPSMSFHIAPKLLLDIIERHGDCVLSPGYLRAEGVGYTYVGCLAAADADKGELAWGSSTNPK